MLEAKLNLVSLKGKMKILHMSWIAFFLSFYVWFNHAPLLASIRESMGLSDQQVKVILILNVALTIPARVIIGMLVDKYGPRRMYSALLFISSFLCFSFAMADTFEQLAITRFLLGFAGAGFVIGIRMVSEWFPAKEVGLAEGIYGGWGNFGSATASMTLPLIVLFFGGENAWRYAVGMTGILSLVFSVIYFFSVSDTPKGSTYFKPKKNGAMEVTSPGDFFLYLLVNIPMCAALAVLAWKLGPANLGLLSATATTIIYLILTGIYAFQSLRIYQINKHVFSESVPKIEQYKFKQVAIINLSYLVTFGSELAVVSMLPLFFLDTFGVSLTTAGLLAGSFSFTNLFARPMGGYLSDRIGRKRSLVLLLAGLSVGYFLMGRINASWPLGLAVLLTFSCATLVTSGNGAVFAMVPLIKRRLTGQVAGMAGAYGNVGAVSFLTVLSFVSPQIFFVVIAAAAVLTLLIVLFFFEEPAGHMAEVLPDGTVQMIEVS
ncbi:Nitrate/nitrite transporter [hydrothermal vent metagenome]|uniref:Nitrate/nitrite transporter n=1 Tax=hydrothermal vent metagenome TaxID=652676 RepID=A0A3B1CT49_9ZZZZ